MPPPLLHSAASGIHPASFILPATPGTPKDGHLRVDTSTTPYQLEVYVAADATWHNVGLVTPVPPGGGGAMSLLYHTLLAAPAASIVTPALGTSASHLWVVALLKGSTASQDTNLQLQINGDTGAHYLRQQQFSGGSVTSAAGNAGATFILLGAVSDTGAAANAAGQLDIFIPGYAGTTFLKTVRARTTLRDISNGIGHYDNVGYWDSTAAISTLTLSPASGNWVAGSELWVYGLA